MNVSANDAVSLLIFSVVIDAFLEHLYPACSQVARLC